MNQSPIVKALVRRLEKAGYVRQGSPLRVASVDFDFTEAMRGSGARSLDLVIIINAATGSFGDTDPVIVRNRVEALSRALDIISSRFTLTVLLVGATLGSEMKALAETCRVLHVPAFAPAEDGEIPENQAKALEDQIRVLLPLELPGDDRATNVGLAGSLERLVSELPDGTDEVLMHDLVQGSLKGSQGVQGALGSRITDVLGTLGDDE